MTLKEPIVEGAYYEREDGQVFGPAAPVIGRPGYWILSGVEFWQDGRESDSDDHPKLTRRVYIVSTDPAEVVAELRELQKTATHMSKTLFENLVAQREHAGAAIAFENAAKLVAKKLGVK